MLLFQEATRYGAAFRGSIRVGDCPEMKISLTSNYYFGAVVSTRFP